MKLWGKNNQLDKKIEQFTIGSDSEVDQKLLPYDCLASIVHVQMLQKLKILTKKEAKQLEEKLREIIHLENKNKFTMQPEDEDGHTAIERYLVENLGETGKKIHTLRSRNDQIQTALRLYFKHEINEVIYLLDNLVTVLEVFRKKYGSISWPGYTHMRKAMPSTVGLWTGAFIESLIDDKQILLGIHQLIDQSPLGTGVGYNLPIAVDRGFTSEKLGFRKIQGNPIYVQNSRGKFESIILNGLTQIMIDLNKIASDLMLFSMSEFGFISLSASHCTGSSMMPHKKNPDVLELIRAKYHMVLSYEFQVKSIIANLPSGYHRDLQLTKEPVINGVENTKESLEVMALVLTHMQVNKEQCEQALTEELFSTDKIYTLVLQGKPFRDAYHEVAEEYR